MSDRLDEVNRNNYLKRNLVKWWNVSFDVSENEETAEDEALEEPEVILDDLDDVSQRLAMSILNENNNQNAFSKANEVVENEERNRKMEAEQEAMEIYNRLMREAEHDEAEKQSEIERAKAGNM